MATRMESVLQTASSSEHRKDPHRGLGLLTSAHVIDADAGVFSQAKAQLSVPFTLPVHKLC